LVRFLISAAQGVNLQPARKSTHLPKFLLILKGLIWIFLGGAVSLSRGSDLKYYIAANRSSLK